MGKPTMESLCPLKEKRKVVSPNRAEHTAVPPQKRLTRKGNKQFLNQDCPAFLTDLLLH